MFFLSIQQLPLRTQCTTCSQERISAGVHGAHVLHSFRAYANSATQLNIIYQVDPHQKKMFLLWPSQQTFRIASKQVLDGADDDLRQELLDRLVDSRLVGPTFQVSSNNDPSRLPMRELPHGSWMNMYLLYKAYARSRNETPASRSTFFAVVQEWKVCIKFHRRTHHQICLTCSTLRSALLNTDEPPFDFNIFFWNTYPAH